MYFDHASTSPCSKALLNLLPVLGERAAFNPSSSHGEGIVTRKYIQEVRSKVAELISCSAEEIFFTSGATESNNLVLQGALNKGKGHLLSSAVEHDSIEANLCFLEDQGYDVTRLPPDRLSTESVLEALREDTFLVSIMLVQNEIGSIYPLPGLGKELRKRGILYHRDAVQAFGKIPFHVEEEQVDFASFSAHKLGALKGLGILYLRKGQSLSPLFYGGEQEKGLRPGTENTLGILALGEILQGLDLIENKGKVSALRKGMLQGILALGGKDLSQGEGSPYILPVSFPLPAEVLLSALSLKGVYASAGSACHARSKRQARILPFLDPRLSQGYLRFSLSPQNTMEEVEDFLVILKETITELKDYL